MPTTGSATLLPGVLVCGTFTPAVGASSGWQDGLEMVTDVVWVALVKVLVVDFEDTLAGSWFYRNTTNLNYFLGYSF